MPSLAEKWYEQGKQEGLYEAIELGLQLKFGKEGKKLFSEVKRIKNINKLKTIKDLLLKAESLQEVKQEIKTKS